jgi:hypothetical protein
MKEIITDSRSPGMSSWGMSALIYVFRDEHILLSSTHGTSSSLSMLKGCVVVKRQSLRFGKIDCGDGRSTSTRSLSQTLDDVLLPGLQTLSAKVLVDSGISWPPRGDAFNLVDVPFAVCSSPFTGLFFSRVG